MEQCRRRMEQILKEPVYSAQIGFLAYGLVASLFTLFWGGDLLDAAAAFPCGLVVRVVLVYLRRLPMSFSQSGRGHALGPGAAGAVLGRGRSIRTK